VSEKTDDYTLVLGDAGKIISFTSIGKWLTIPANSSVAFPVGTSIFALNANSTGELSIGITSDTLYRPGAGDRYWGGFGIPPGASVQIIKVAPTVWYVVRGWD